MAYHNRNQIERQKQVLEITERYFEPGRQDRCLRWVWQKYIHGEFHIEYNTYLIWLRSIKRRLGMSASSNVTDLLNRREMSMCHDMKPVSTLIHTKTDLRENANAN